jgi:UDP:flavonoid glycosyltransferase YjiC (YdhE family)
MKKLLLCWELGDDFGHLGKYHRISSIFTERGYQVFILLKDLSKVGRFVWPTGVTILYCPQAKLRLQKAPTTQCHAEILLINGYHSANTLKYLVLAWRHLFDWINPDVILFDHSPTALLASRDKKIPRIIISDPFVVPPANQPAISLRAGTTSNTEAIEKSEGQVVTVINEVAEELNVAPVKHSSDLFAVDKTLLYGYQETDIFDHARKNATYIGALIAKGGFKQPRWKQPTSTKIFAYLKYGNPLSEMILSILYDLRANLVCFYSGASKNQCAKYESSTVLVDNQLFDSDSIYTEANCIVCHAGGGTVYPSLYYGLPIICAPLQLEQYCSAERLEVMKMGINIHKHLSLDEAKKKMTDFFSNPIYAENAKRFGARVRPTVRSLSGDWICDEIESLLVEK